MPTLNFKARFADAVELGEKTQTLRRPRKRPIKVGDKLYLYTGLRTKKARKLGEGTCVSIERMWLYRPEHVYRMGWYGLGLLAREEVRTLAKNDGFMSAAGMFAFFDKLYGLPVDLDLIQWELL